MHSVAASQNQSIEQLTCRLGLPAGCTVSVRHVDWQMQPVELAARLAGSQPMVFIDCNSLLHSNWGQVSVLGCGPLLEIVVDAAGNSVVKLRSGQHFQVEPGVALDGDFRQLPFAGGWIGYIGYEFGRFIEDLPAAAVDDIKLPVMWLALFDCAAVFDHDQRRWSVVGLEFQDGMLRELQQKHAVAAADWIDRPIQRQQCHLTAAIQSNMSAEQYRRIVARAVEYIHAGDIFQVNLSQRLTVGFEGDPCQLYSKLRLANPGGFNAYLAFSAGAVLSTSPELFLRINDDYVITRPIKGTRPRGGDAREDHLLARQLTDSIKDRAELNMIIDLERNDLGRVCRFGTVRVLNGRVLETHPSVFHLVGQIEGRLRTGIRDGGFIDLLRATYPGGSITGAPKIRSIQIIDELEPTVRSVYTGSIGYLSLNGNSVWNIAIRTAICASNKLHLQLGAGIVADSDPQAEYDETLAKGKAMLRGLDLTVNGKW